MKNALAKINGTFDTQTRTAIYELAKQGRVTIAIWRLWISTERSTLNLNERTPCTENPLRGKCDMYNIDDVTQARFDRSDIRDLLRICWNLSEILRQCRLCLPIEISYTCPRSQRSATGWASCLNKWSDYFGRQLHLRRWWTEIFPCEYHTLDSAHYTIGLRCLARTVGELCSKKTLSREFSRMGKNERSLIEMDADDLCDPHTVLCSVWKPSLMNSISFPLSIILQKQNFLIVS